MKEIARRVASKRSEDGSLFAPIFPRFFCFGSLDFTYSNLSFDFAQDGEPVYTELVEVSNHFGFRNSCFGFFCLFTFIYGIIPARVEMVPHAAVVSVRCTLYAKCRPLSVRTPQENAYKTKELAVIKLVIP